MAETPRRKAGEMPMTRLDVINARVEAALAGALIVMAILWLLNVPRLLRLALFTEQYMAIALGLALCLLFLNYDVRGARRTGFRAFDATLALWPGGRGVSGAALSHSRHHPGRAAA